MNIGTLVVIRGRTETHDGKMMEIVRDHPEVTKGSLSVNFAGTIRGISADRVINLDEGFEFTEDWYPWYPNFRHSFPEEPVDYEARRDSDGRGPGTT